MHQNVSATLDAMIAKSRENNNRLGSQLQTQSRSQTKSLSHSHSQSQSQSLLDTHSNEDQAIASRRDDFVNKMVFNGKGVAQGKRSVRKKKETGKAAGAGAAASGSVVTTKSKSNNQPHPVSSQ